MPFTRFNTLNSGKLEHLLKRGLSELQLKEENGCSDEQIDRLLEKCYPGSKNLRKKARRRLINNNVAYREGRKIDDKDLEESENIEENAEEIVLETENPYFAQYYRDSEISEEISAEESAEEDIDSDPNFATDSSASPYSNPGIIADLSEEDSTAPSSDLQRFSNAVIEATLAETVAALHETLSEASDHLQKIKRLRVDNKDFKDEIDKLQRKISGCDRLIKMEKCAKMRRPEERCEHEQKIEELNLQREAYNASISELEQKIDSNEAIIVCEKQSIRELRRCARRLRKFILELKNQLKRACKVEILVFEESFTATIDQRDVDFERDIPGDAKYYFKQLLIDMRHEDEETYDLRDDEIELCAKILAFRSRYQKSEIIYDEKATKYISTAIDEAIKRAENRN